MSGEDAAGGPAAGDASTGEPILEIEGLEKYFRQDDSLLDRLLSRSGPTHVRAVDGVDLTVHEGETVGLVGESGCGKSTLARAALQLLDPTDGSVRFRGEELTEYSRSEERSFRQRAQVVFQDPYASLNERYSVYRTLAEPMAEHGLPTRNPDPQVDASIDVTGSVPGTRVDPSVHVDRLDVVAGGDGSLPLDVDVAVDAEARPESASDVAVSVSVDAGDSVLFREDDVRVVKELDGDTLAVSVTLDVKRSDRELRRKHAGDLLERVGLSRDHLDRYPHEFSGGQRQRIAIARALSVEPELLVADEPTSALDVSVQAQIINLLEGLKAEMGLSMLFISHDLSVVRRLCDRVAVMYLGEIVEIAPTDELFENPSHPYTKALLSSIPIPDPTRSREQIPLEGDVPTPIDPPSGCRFHPRCPEIIPPADWAGSQEGFRRIFRLKSQLANGDIDPDAAFSALTADGEFTTDDAVAAELYERHIDRRDEVDAEPVDLPAAAEAVVREALETLVDGDREAAVEAMDEAFESVCASRDPALAAGRDSSHLSACHLQDSQMTESRATEAPEPGLSAPDGA